MLRLTLTLPVLLLTLLVGNPVFSDDLQKGLDAANRGDYATALREWKPLAQQGNARAQHNLGNMYRDGLGVPQETKTAVKWYILAAEQGLADAQYNLGWMYQHGRGVPEDDKTAVKWWTIASNQGNARAQTALGTMYLNGQGVPQDYKIAVKLTRLAAEQGLTDAQFNLGMMYGKGLGVSRDNVYAYMWFNISVLSGNVRNALVNRDILEKIMPASRIAKAQKLARECVKKNYKGC